MGKCVIVLWGPGWHVEYWTLEGSAWLCFSWLQRLYIPPAGMTKLGTASGIAHQIGRKNDTYEKSLLILLKCYCNASFSHTGPLRLWTQTVSCLVTVIPICTWQEYCKGVINSEIGVKHTLSQLLTAAEGVQKRVGPVAGFCNIDLAWL